MSDPKTSAPAQTTPAPNSPSDNSPSDPGFGWTNYAEKINGRFAMVGFIALLILEFFTHQDFLTWLGLR
jgi:Chlorophyll A-B binding protein